MSPLNNFCISLVILSSNSFPLVSPNTAVSINLMGLLNKTVGSILYTSGISVTILPFSFSQCFFSYIFFVFLFYQKVNILYFLQFVFLAYNLKMHESMLTFLLLFLWLPLYLMPNLILYMWIELLEINKIGNTFITYFFA